MLYAFCCMITLLRAHLFLRAVTLTIFADAAFSAAEPLAAMLLH